MIFLYMCNFVLLFHNALSILAITQDPQRIPKEIEKNEMEASASALPKGRPALR